MKRFIYLSSAAVYGEPKSVPVSEDAPTYPISFYGVSKLVGEEYCRLFNSADGLGTISLRLFNVYGPRQSHGPYAGVITTFVDRLFKNRSLTIYGDGLQTRDFVHVADVVQAVVAVASSKSDTNGKVFNIGSGKAITIRSLAQRLANICGKRLEPRYTRPRKGDIRRSCADVKRAADNLGFRSRVPLDQGLADYVASRRKKS